MSYAWHLTRARACAARPVPVSQARGVQRSLRGHGTAQHARRAALTAHMRIAAALAACLLHGALYGAGARRLADTSEPCCASSVTPAGAPCVQVGSAADLSQALNDQNQVDRADNFCLVNSPTRCEPDALYSGVTARAARHAAATRDSVMNVAYCLIRCACARSARRRARPALFRAV